MDDEERCTKFYAECDAAHRLHGFTGPDGCCPALIAENDRSNAECALLEVAGKWFGYDPMLLWGGKRKEMLDLLLGANAIKYRKK